MLNRMFNIKKDFSETFIDVNENSYYFNDVNIFKYLGIVEGYNNKFYPSTAITREDAIVITYRLLDYLGKFYNYNNFSINHYNDNDEISSYAKEAVYQLTNKNIITGYNNKISPKSFITRAESSVIIKRIYDLYIAL